ncbi:hypothetical protein JVU11DRAFT_8727 [Chiua virens]|nr:hypothetical protein JVU11DRAFT_8727 [Chiua virens]
MSTDHDESSPTIPALSLGSDATVLPPTASSLPPLDHLTTETIIEPSETITQLTSSRPPSLHLSDTPHLILPIPTPSLNKSQSSVVFSHAVVTSEDDWGSLSPEVATADISIAPDGSFVETSSGPAARELKRRYDQYLGVGKDVRSPYAITAFVNQHGKQMFRVGDRTRHRDAIAPAAEAESKAQKVSTSIDMSHAHGRSFRGRSRMSVHHILTHNKPKPVAAPKLTPTLEAPTGRKFLRRTRSIPDMFGVAISTSSSEDPSRQATPTGRTHSHSVTGADMPRPLSSEIPSPEQFKPTCGDVFAETMRWPSGPFPSSPLVSGSSGISYILYPFGPGITFDSPAPLFESGLTARADNMMQHVGTGPASPPDADTTPDSDSPSPPPRLAVSPFGDDSDIPPHDPALAPLPETSMHSRYSPEVFDVLQTYRGLPLLDHDDQNVACVQMIVQRHADDPRFVLWGEMHLPSDVDTDEASLSQSSRTGTGVSSPISPASSRRGKPSVDIPSLRISTDDPNTNEDEDGRRVLLAATIERWIAQLTSDFNYDELLNFFLTYRTYISAVDLCHLLICRFHWSLSGHATKQDDLARKIVRVRTFVAIRYWLLTFFVMDFLPNRELRLLLASWLNALVKDPVLKRHQDGLSIVRKLIKVVKDCKEAHTRRRYGTSSARQSISIKPRPTHVLGEKFAEAISKDQDDSDVDLDFAPEERVSVFLGSGGESGTAFAFGSSSGVTSAPRANAIASASTAILQQPLQRNILQQSRASISVAPGATPILAQAQPSITFPQRALSRVFVKTIGRLGRWKRVLNSRQTMDTGIAVPANVSAFDLELSASGDLLGVRGGVEQYLKMIEPQSPVTSGAGDLESETKHTTQVVSRPEEGKLPLASSSSHHLRSVSEVTEEEEAQTETTETATMGGRRMSSALSAVSRATMSTRTHSTESFGSILSSRSRLNPLVAQVQAQPPWRFDVVSIDELDLSDTSSEFQRENANVPPPPGLRKVPRKLPLRRDFEFIRRSGESVSSYGDTITRFGCQWQVNAIVDSLSDAAEGGGIEEALRRLEGQINPQRRKENAIKVDGWVRTIQERMAAGDFGDERPRFFDGSDEEADDAYDIDQHETGSVRRRSLASRDPLPETPSRITVSVATEPEDYFSSEPRSGSSVGYPATPVDTVASPIRGVDAKPAPEDAVPLEILQSRVASRPSTSHGSPMGPRSPALMPGTTVTSPTKMLSPTGRKSHRSWVLNVRVDVLAQHFAMIDRELFMGIKPEELIMDDWMSCPEVNVLDWAQYLKDRALWKAESRNPHKTSALAVVRGRFNLMANFVVTEIVMTPPSDRHTLVAKFIRLAFKSYSHSNFHTLAAVLAGLRNEWVNKAMHRHWGRVGPWEMQIYQKLSQFVNAEDDFKAMHEAISAMVDAKPIDVHSHASTILSSSTSDSQSWNKSIEGSAPSACVPFIGIYLAQLSRYSKLPDLIDPTAPNEPVSIDPQAMSFDSPSHPEIFESLTPLPPSMQLEPLINVHKQRLIAGVIKDLVAGQHLASRVQFTIDKKLFQRCLRIRGLETEVLHQVYRMYCDPTTRPMPFLAL